MRGAGILLHISSLPSQYGIGTMGKEAYNFVDFLERAGQKYWQVLPVHPTTYGDSPYQTTSAFAGNPYFIDLDILIEEGLITEEEVSNYYFGKEETDIDFLKMFQNRYPILRTAFSRFEPNDDYYRFVEHNRSWLSDYALFMSIKEEHNYRSWQYWNEPLRRREESAMNEARRRLSKNIDFYYFLQYKFFEQWQKLKAYANEHHIAIIGDMPIYVAYDSSEVWSHPELFELDPDTLLPVRVAGCPPDCFAEKGQLWGNPLYNWDKMKSDRYDWWIKRIKKSFELYDYLRIDHFRGFEAYYAIPYEREDACIGEWVKGVGYELFEEIKNRLGNVNIIAEDLGFLTEGVHELLNKCGYPGMKVLQFGFDPYSDSGYLPHNYTRNSIAYTGTHDNDTLIGWYTTVSPEEKKFINSYLGIRTKKELVTSAVRLLMASCADTVIVPIQDYLNKGSESRMNIPSTVGGNWGYRIAVGELTDELADWLSNLTRTFRR